ncbi:hypothetical protein FW778_01170 [Ginsengibacter hankyongi]|uniref:Uncharacterized protein n=1 Tax=Ginsengibacter hankyongi TaxID=2607284 RepID=A0A5J5II37_9BACT|nr:hypothetical protein [Ginsengibacter hankyongi]KAA9040680.1 hypothetical protein FW778_01170 [Ginsengibacter hankyongi]
MIEQTELIITEWNYQPPLNYNEAEDKILSFTSLDVMKKRAPTKKGIACRFTCQFVIGHTTILEYVGEDSYVIDLPDVIDKRELLIMIRNSYSKFQEKFDLRKFGTILQGRTLAPLDESQIGLDSILPLLV